ncbi:hypothetical protein RJ639_006269 [Escallonia herrerae]|uniref:Uncharacterized protein n=1 Tax=Escallonia herrerae TaxID=1293975 RepID=A0AA88VVU3_9ASTE|nr:hypothetical protein RJ639_006269 [Escallonia herrerae]
MLNRPEAMGKAMAIYEQVEAGKTGKHDFHCRSETMLGDQRMRLVHPGEQSKRVNSSQKYPKALLNVLRDELGNILENVNYKPSLTEVSIYATITIGENGLGCRDKLKQRLLYLWNWVRPNYHSRCPVTKQSLPNKIFEMGITRPMECNCSDLRANNKHTGSFVVLG